MKKPEQIYPPENVEDVAEAGLKETYGPKQKSVNPGLHWLFGADGTHPGYLDHPEYRRKDGKRTMIGRPYGLGLEDLQSLVELARKKGVDVAIHTPSNYNYRTVLVIITEWTPSECFEARRETDE